MSHLVLRFSRKSIWFSCVGMRFSPSQVFYNSGKQNTYMPQPGPFFLISYLDGSEGGDALGSWFPKGLQMVTVTAREREHHTWFPFSALSSQIVEGKGGSKLQEYLWLLENC